MTRDDLTGPYIARNTNTPWFKAVYDDEDNVPMNDSDDRTEYKTLEEAERKYAER